MTPVIWITGLPAAGKSSLALALAKKCQEAGRPHEILDGDDLRAIFSVGFSEHDRTQHVVRTAHLASILSKHGVLPIVALISPHLNARARARSLCKKFIEVYLNTPLAVCQQRDTKGNYAKALRGELPNFTGVSDTYQPPLHPEFCFDATDVSSLEMADCLWNQL